MTDDEAYAQIIDLARAALIDDLPRWQRLVGPGEPYPDAPLTVYLAGPDQMDAWRPFVTITAETSEPKPLDPGWWTWRVEGRLKTAAETPVVLVAPVKVERPAVVAGRPA